MRRSRVVVAAVVIALALACLGSGADAGSPIPGSTVQVTLPMSDGAKLACSVTYPENVPHGTLPGGGHAGLVLFPGLGQTHRALESLGRFFAGDGYETLQCDARGTGASEGQFGFDGPRDVRDARALVAWLARQLGNRRIGGFGTSLGGGEVWNAAAAGVPFKAIVPANTWTSLRGALHPNGVPKEGLVKALARAAPSSRWDPRLARAWDLLRGGSVTRAVKAVEAARSSRSRLHSLRVPTLMLQGRHDPLFDIGEALAAYRLLRGPRELYLGALGEAPARTPAAEESVYLKLAAAFFGKYLKRTKGVGLRASGWVLLAHDPWDGSTTSFKGLPPIRSVSVNLPGPSKLVAGKLALRSVRLTGGPLETFGGGSVTVRYSGAGHGWTQLVATVSVQGKAAPATEGAIRIAKPAGLIRIPLMDESVLLPLGKKLVVTVGASSPDGVYGTGGGGNAPITIGRVTLSLSVLDRAVSR